VPTKTYFQVWRQNSGASTINISEDVNYVINSGCTVGGRSGVPGSRWIIEKATNVSDGKLVESPNGPSPFDPMMKENIDKCLAEAKSSGDY